VTWIAAIVVAPLALAVIVIALPFQVRARGGVADGELSGAAAIAWAFGLAAVELRPGSAVLRLAGIRAARLRGWRAPGGGRRRPGRERGRPDRAGRKGPVARLRGALAHRGHVLRMGRRLVRALHLRLRLRGRVGAADPADTATVAALVEAARRVPGVELQVAVDWLDEVLELEADGSAWIWVPEVLAVAGWLWLARGNRLAVRALAG